ncbi:putative ATP-dependent RNA helicase DDX10 [Oryzias melastigma]|uniref:ATP-dependent RNA helicase n=1 Tax=Oryzias melastigma TaxID=30732 RepID=A0A834CKV9_ORYME|nr:putative ATP-dependent RNA helicase DDX10 [Oryzias melastigma]
MGKRPKSSGTKPASSESLTGIAVKNFEKWKKRYNKKKSRVKRERAQKKKPDWQVEREYIQNLVRKYEDVDSNQVVKFSDFPISKKTLLGLQESQFRQPTEIQRQTIGLALRGKDVLGAAKTGSGKTLAFLIPVLECLYRQQWSSMDGLGALIISPTRELAYQTFEVLRKVGKNHEFSAGLVIGGKDLQTEAERIPRTNIVVCTPGRLLQHMDQTACFHASGLLMLVLDEADRILDMGFADTLNAIVENLPRTRQTLLFSATQTKSVKDLARLSLKDPEYVWVHEKARFSTPASLEQSYVVCELHQKVDLLFSFIRGHLTRKIIVFFSCCKQVNPEKLQSVQQKLEAFLAQEKEQKERAQRCFVSYLRSVHLMKNKAVFDVSKLNINQYALSLGLAVAPRVRFLHKTHVQEKKEEEEEEDEEEEDLRSFKARLKGNSSPEENRDSDSENSEEDEEDGSEEDVQSEDEDEEDLRDLDLLTVKRKDVFGLDPQSSDEADGVPKKRGMAKETKFKEAKKVLKRNFKVNTKVTFNEEGGAVQVWPPVQRKAAGEEEEEEKEEESGINVEKAKERLKREDEEFDKQEYSRKVKAKHRERRLKEREARREASKRGRRQEDEEEDEVVAYLANQSDDEFDPSSLPDPDKLQPSEEEEEEEEEEDRGSAKHSHRVEDDEEEELTPEKKIKMDEEEPPALDTGLTLAEDEELVLQLLRGQR